MILILSLVFLTGCSWTGSLTQPEHADKAVYKRYEIQMPERPKLETSELSPGATIGQSVRAYENDLTNLVEYSLQLENLLAPIANEEKGYDVEPSTIEPLPEAKPWYKFW